MKETLRGYYDSAESYFKKDFTPLEKLIIGLVIFFVGLTLGVVIGVLSMKSKKQDEEELYLDDEFDDEFEEDEDEFEPENKQIPGKATETTIPEEELFSDIDIPLDGEKKAFWRFKK